MKAGGGRARNGRAGGWFRCGRGLGWFLGLGLVLAAPPGAGAAAEELFVIEDAGQPRPFAVALDELSLSTPAARRVIAPIAPAADRAALKAAAAARKTDPAHEVELVLYEMRRGERFGPPRILTREVLVRAGSAEAAARAAQAAGAAGLKATGVAGLWLAEGADALGALDLALALRKQAGIEQAEPLLARQQTRKWTPNDTNFSKQWHLVNTGQSNGVAGTDVRVTNVWDTYRGTNMQIAIIDDGLQTGHPDLSGNCNTAIDRDINYNDNDPSPDIAGDDHGTACAGVAAAVGNNNLGVCGAAPQAKLVGLRLISAAASDSDEALAMNWSNQVIQVKNNSWGPDDDGLTVEGPGALTAAAFSNACATGRGGRGVILVWAGGNGLDSGDDSNFDGYANSIHTLAVGAVANTSTQSWYSEPGANLVVCAPSSGDNRSGVEVGIWTTDRTGTNGYNTGSTAGEPTDANYTSTFGGTSSAAPLVSGVIALLLQANPNLGWRDVQEILMRSATKNAATDADWRTNAAGFKINHKYGGGMVNASGAVALAAGWVNLPAQSILVSNRPSLSVNIPDFGSGAVTQTFNMANATMRVEHVQVVVSATHAWRGDLGFTLVSPGGTTSVISRLQRNDNGTNYTAWPFMSVRNWGEDVSGTWRVKIEDLGASDTGRLTALKLVFYGTVRPAKAAGPTPAHLATGVATNAALSWTAATDATGYRVSFGTVSPPPFVRGQATNTFTTNLALGTTYYWRIDPTNVAGTTTGDVWQFTTAVPALGVEPGSTGLTAAAWSGRTLAVTGNVAWTAASNAAWLAVTGGSSGSGNGTVTFSVAANAGATARTGGVVVAGGGLARTCVVVQAGTPAALEIDPAGTNLSSAAWSGRTIAVTASSAWTAASNAAWLAVTGGGSGSGDGTVTFGVAANGTPAARTGAVIVAGGGFSRTCTVVQAGAVGNPAVQADGQFGVEADLFGFNLNWSSGQVVVVDACTDLAAPVWVPLQTNLLTGPAVYFSDPQWGSYTGRFYRLRAP